MPRIPDGIKDSTFFLYSGADEARQGAKFGGTGFVLSLTSERVPEITYFYGVTNWHVAVSGGFSTIRFNNENGGTNLLEKGPEDWIFDPDGYDLAIIPIPPNVVPLTPSESLNSLKPIPTTLIYKRDQLLDPNQLNVGLGDDVFMLGRFVDMDDDLINSPTARFGCISVMPSPIKQCGPKNGFKDCYCLDMHSRSGYSGSPVFVYRTPGTSIDHILKTGSPDLTRTMLCLLGVHFAQFPEELRVMGNNEQKLFGPSGMTCVIPSWKILDLLNTSELVTERARSDAIWEERIRNESP